MYSPWRGAGGALAGRSGALEEQSLGEVVATVGLVLLAIGRVADIGRSTPVTDLRPAISGAEAYLRREAARLGFRLTPDRETP